MEPLHVQANETKLWLSEIYERRVKFTLTLQKLRVYIFWAGTEACPTRKGGASVPAQLTYWNRAIFPSNELNASILSY